MRCLLAILALTALSVCLAACGDSRTHSTSQASSGTVASSPFPTTNLASSTDYAKVDGDKDNDVGAAMDDKNNSRVVAFGHTASASERQTITALLKRYYTIALAGDGARGCAMLYSTLAESVPEDYGVASGPPFMRGASTCQAGMTALFEHFHSQLAVEVPKLEVIRVQLEEHHGIVLLRFGSLPERQISIQREGHIWRMAGLLDRQLP